MNESDSATVVADLKTAAEYITDISGAKEIKYVPSEYLHCRLHMNTLNDKTIEKYREQKRRIAKNRRLITSHMIVVVDQSGSMRKETGHIGVSRLEAVYRNIAVELIAKRLNEDTVSYTDVLSVVTMGNGAKFALKWQPTNWSLYNTVLRLASQSSPHSHGKYIPAMNLVHKLAMYTRDLKHVNVAVMFLSDGAPSDISCGSTPDSFETSLFGLIANLCLVLENRLSFNTMLFSNDSKNVAYHGEVLRKMMTTATSHGAQGVFNCGPSEALHYSFSSMVTSMTATKTHLQDWGDTELNSDISRLDRISQKATSADDPKCEYKRYLRKRDELQKYLFIPHAKGPCRWEAVATPTGVEIQNGYFGVGAERIVKFMDVVDVAGNVVATPLVAEAAKKESGHKQGRTFHIPLFMTQFTAQEYATQFNKALDELGVGQNVPRVSFLGCCLYEFFNSDADEYQWVLCEKRLDRPKYCKWNDNCGYVRGFAEPLGTSANPKKKVAAESEPFDQRPPRVGRSVQFHSCVEFDINPDEDVSDTINDEADAEELRNRYRAQYKRSFNGERFTLSPQIDWCILSKELPLAPCDTWNDSESSYECLGPSAMLVDASPAILEAQKRVLDDDIPQAFTHYTYARSRRTLMVCDLQGVLDHTRTPVVFEFTDPCIHHRTTKPNQTHTGSKTRMGKRKAFSNTDLGRAGMHKIFLSHTCNAVCDILGIMEMKEIDKNAGELYVTAPGIDNKIENKIVDDF